MGFYFAVSWIIYNHLAADIQPLNGEYLRCPFSMGDPIHQSGSGGGGKVRLNACMTILWCGRKTVIFDLLLMH
jgi:hypothetical protein